MPLYEFRCVACGAVAEVFARSIGAEVETPACPKHAGTKDHTMVRAISQFQRHMTEADKVAEAEAKWGKEVDAAMGPEPDIGKYADRYGALAKDLPSPDDI